MRLKVNGAHVEVEDDLTVRALLERLGMPSRAVAVAVNRSVVPRSRHDEHRLHTDDEVEIVRAVGGG